jgi:hypothetical protein
MGIQQKSTRAFAQSTELASAWLEAVDDVLKAAQDTATHASGEPTGKSRTASIRRLKASIDNLEKLEKMIGE